MAPCGLGLVTGAKQPVERMTMPTTTTTKATVTIALSEQRPVKIIKADWPIIAKSEGHDGAVQCQANTEWYIRVREHSDGRRIVYCGNIAGNGGQYAGFEETRGGFLVDSSNNARGPGEPGCYPDESETIRAIRRCAGLIGRDNCGDFCIADLPAEVLS